MAYLLGVDTGGTYTDAVLIKDERDVLASAKALTTREDLAIGVGEAVGAVFAVQSGISPDQIAMVSLSTTLATNALVEGQGERIALIYVGFRDRDLDGHGLREALKGDPYLLCAGGHDHAGSEVAALDIEGIRRFVSEVGPTVSAFAVAAQFATRNPAHERAIAQIVSELTGKPVSSSHQLSARLNGPKRAMTALLNARLVGMIDRLIGRAEDKLRDLGIQAPMMVVRGDGALMSSQQARERPIETILSGPAASIVGARWLTGASDALVSDIGGTTTDVALLSGGRPAIDPAGAQVGPYRTMVEAVAMRTTGLGGDSEVSVNVEGLKGGLRLGPRRVLPVALLAHNAPDIVHDTLDAQLRNTVPGEHDGRFLRLVQGRQTGGLGFRETAILERLGDTIRPVGDVIKARIDQSALTRLVERGIVQMGGVTPSDASHILGTQSVWDADAARKALELMARKRTGSGNVLAQTPSDLAHMIVDRLTYQTGLALLEAAFEEDAEDFGASAFDLARHALMQKGLSGHKGVLRIESGLNVPVIGLGASAATYYPAVGDAMGTEMILPDHAEVANAIGAVVGRISMRHEGTVTSPAEGKYRVHLAGGPADFVDSSEAMQVLEEALRKDAEEEARIAGAADIQVTARRHIKSADVEARQIFVEALIEVEAAGRPRIARG